MGLFRYTIALAMVVGLSAVLIQRYSPETVDRVLSDPSVKEYTAKANKFIQEAGGRIKDAGRPLLDGLKVVVLPLFDYTNLANRDGSTDYGASTKAKTAKTDANKKDEPKETKQRVISVEELKQYDGKPDSKGLYLALMGLVFDVKKGEKFYGPGGGYEFFAGRDATRAFVSGQFDEEGLTDDVRGMTYQDYIGFSDWLAFYLKDYTCVGKVAGRYYTNTGEPTEYKLQADRWLTEAKEDKQKQENEKKMFPPCNSEWSADKGSRVWCTKKSGGVERSWKGVPRQLFTPGEQKPRCACVKRTGSPLSTAGGDTKLPGDLGHPHIKEYQGCPPKNSSCFLPKDE